MNKRSKAAYSIVLIMLAIAFTVVIAIIQRYRVIIVVTDSMEPAVMVNSISILDKCRIDDVEINDIIMYQSHVGFKVTHRVIRLKQEKGELKLYTQGDSNPTRDKYPITKDNFIGKLIYTNNSIAKYISTDKKVYSLFDYGTIVLIFGVLLFIISIEIMLVTKGIKYIFKNKKSATTEREH